jgi:hypothetical protein
MMAGISNLLLALLYYFLLLDHYIIYILSICFQGLKLCLEMAVITMILTSGFRDIDQTQIELHICIYRREV